MTGVVRIGRSLRRVLAIIRKEFQQLARDRLTLAMIVGIPTLQLVLFGYAIELDVRHIPTVVLDESKSALSRKLIGELEATQTFRIVADARSERELLGMLERSEVGAAILIPPDLDRRLRRGRGAEISILADASNPTVAAAVALTGQGFGHEFALRVRPGGRGSLGDRPDGSGTPRSLGPAPDLVREESVRVAVVPLYNPERRTPVFIVPGLIGVILTMTMMLMTALAIVRERERGTFEFLITTPIKRSELMVGKIVPYVIVGHVQVGLILVLGVVLFDIPMHGSLVDFGLATLIFIAAMLAMGLVISSAARSQFQAVQMAFFFFLPSLLLSGFMFPFEAMPVPAQWVGEVLPLTHFLRIVRGILLKGASLGSLLGEIAAIVAFMGVTLTLTVMTFRKRLD